MKFTNDVVVLSARRYSMVDDKTGEVVQGCKIQYVEDWEGQLQQNRSGVAVLSANLPYDRFGDFAKLPATYSATFQLEEGARGRPQLRMISVEFKTPFAVPRSSGSGK